MNPMLLAQVVMESRGCRTALDNFALFTVGEHGYVKYDIRRAHTYGHTRPVVKCECPSNLASFLIAVEETTADVWVIPVEDILGLKTIRLGKRWECYKHTVIIKAPSALEVEGDDLKTAASKAAKKMREMKT